LNKYSLPYKAFDVEMKPHRCVAAEDSKKIANKNERKTKTVLIQTRRKKKAAGNDVMKCSFLMLLSACSGSWNFGNEHHHRRKKGETIAAIMQKSQPAGWNKANSLCKTAAPPRRSVQMPAPVFIQCSVPSRLTRCGLQQEQSTRNS
jgi:hypothetical protein